MHYPIFLVILVAILGAKASKPVIFVPPAITEKFTKTATQCIKDTGAPEDCLDKTLPWKLARNELTEKYLLCVTQNAKLAGPDGHYFPDKVMTLFVNTDKMEDIKKTFAECNALEGDNAHDVNFKITDCFHKKAPVILSF